MSSSPEQIDAEKIASEYLATNIPTTEIEEDPSLAQFPPFLTNILQGRTTALENIRVLRKMLL